MRTDKRDDEFGNDIPLIYPGERPTHGTVIERLERRQESRLASTAERLRREAAEKDESNEPFDPKDPVISENMAAILEDMEQSFEDYNRKMSGASPPDPNKQVGWHQAICALLVCSTITSAARECGIGERTLRRWLENRDFRNLYYDARSRVIETTVDRMCSLREKAAKKLEQALESDDVWVSMRAVNLIYRNSGGTKT